MGIVSDGGVAPNIIPEMASATIWVRYFADETKLGSVSPKKQGELIDAKVEQLKNTARGAALATNGKIDIDLYGTYVHGISEAGHKGLVLAGKAMGATGLRLALDPEMQKKVRAAFDSWLKKYDE